MPYQIQEKVYKLSTNPPATNLELFLLSNRFTSLCLSFIGKFERFLSFQGLTQESSLAVHENTIMLQLSLKVQNQEIFQRALGSYSLLFFQFFS